MFAQTQKAAFFWQSLLCTFLLLLFAITAASAQSAQRLTVPDSLGGSPVALWENRAIVGVRGGACIFEFNGTRWIPVAELQPTGVGNRFGLSVDIRDDRAIIGDMSSQRAFVFGYRPKRHQWVQEAELVSPTAGDDSYGFGVSVSIQGRTAIVGNHMDNELGTSSGAAYVYRCRKGEWILSQKLVPTVPTFIEDPTDSTTSINFDFYLYGWSTSIDRLRAVVASYWQSAAYVYVKRFGSWREQQVLEQLFPLLPSVDVSGRFIAANTSEDVFVFDRRQGNWVGTRISRPAGNAFGANPVAITPKALAFQREFEDFDEPEPQNKVFLYERTGRKWNLQRSLKRPHVPAFGTSLDLYDDKLLVGTEGGFAGVYPIGDSEAARTAAPQDTTQQASDDIVASLTSEQSVRVYPVPLQDQLHVALGTPTAHPVHVTLYDMFGRQLATTDQVSSVVAGTLTLDLSATKVPSGVVFLEINSLETGRQLMRLLKN